MRGLIIMSWGKPSSISLMADNLLSGVGRLPDKVARSRKRDLVRAFGAGLQPGITGSVRFGASQGSAAQSGRTRRGRRVETAAPPSTVPLR